MIINKRFYLILLLCLNFTFVIFSGVYYNLLSLIVANIFFLLAGSFFSIKLVNKEHINNSLVIFLLFFLIYSLFTFITDLLYVQNQSTDFFFTHDSITFYNILNKYLQINHFSESIDGIFYDYTSLEWIGFAYFNYLFSYPLSFFDPITQIVLKTNVVFFSTMILVYMYRILLRINPNLNNLMYVVVYGFLSYSFFFSAIFIRDVHIGFLFILLIDKFFIKPRLSKLPVIILIILIVATFRPEHGLFASIFLFAYVYYYVKSKNNRQFQLLFIPVVISIITLSYVIFNSQIQEIFLTVNESSEKYEKMSLSSASSNSLGTKLLRLPMGVRQLAGGMFSQINPFPFYAYNVSYGWIVFPFGTGAIFWFVVWFLLLKTFYFFGYNNKYKFQINMLFILSIVLILAASANVGTRRVMCIYPVIYFLLISLLKDRSRKYVIKSSVQGLLIYLLLLSVYLFIK